MNCFIFISFVGPRCLLSTRPKGAEHHGLFSVPLQATLPEVQHQYQAVLKEIKVLQQQEHAMQEESLSVRLRVEQIETTMSEHSNKIKHWQKEVGSEACGHLCSDNVVLLKVT